MKKYVYIVQEVTLSAKDIIGGVVIGAYSTVERAKLAIKVAKSGLKKQKNKTTEYDIVIMPMNESPSVEDVYEQALYGLIERGLMEVFIGEDGYFIYELTKKGRKIAKELGKNMGLLDDELNGGETGID